MIKIARRIAKKDIEKWTCMIQTYFYYMNVEIDNNDTRTDKKNDSQVFYQINIFMKKSMQCSSGQIFIRQGCSALIPYYQI